MLVCSLLLSFLLHLSPLFRPQSDIADKREVSYGEGELLARTLKCPFFETSAKLRSNVDECFHELVREIKKVQQERSREANEKPQKSGCCTLL